MKKINILLKTLVFCIITLLHIQIILAQKVPSKTAIRSGNWNTASTWGNGNPTVPTSTDVVIINTDVNVTVDGNATCSSLTIGSGKGTSASLTFAQDATLTISGNLTVGDAVSGNINMSAGTSNCNLVIGGAVTITKGGIWTPGSGTVIFNGTSNQTLPSSWMTSFNNLTLSGSGIKTLAASTTVAGNLTINSGTTFHTNNQALILQGNFINSGTFNAGSSAIILSGDKIQSIDGISTTGTVTVNKSANAATLTGSSTFTGLTITAGNLTIPAGGQVTVSGNLTNNAGASGLSLLSDASGTGSLIVKGTATTAQATVKRYMTSGAWHLVTAPVTGQTIGSFLSGNTAIPTPVGATDPRAMRAYDPAANQWGEFFNSTNANQIITGTGYCMRVKASAANHEVVFTGALQAGDILVNGLSEGKWNCIGNPYTSAIGITNSASSTDNFLNVNALTNANIDPTSGIYIWDNPDEVNGQPGKYTTISNALNRKGLHYLQQGQGFMVKMASGKTSVSFTKAMQVPDPSLSLKSTEDIWPTITLIASADSVNSSTVIAFHEGMTNGLDVTFDAGLLKSGGPMELYTRLVDDYGIPFAIQALASDQYDRLIIPVGVDYSKGGKVSFSAQSFYLPSSCRPILEDRLKGLFTDLTDKTYTANLTSNTAETGRFFLHTSYATTGTDSRQTAQKLSAWALNRQEININGKVNNGAVASLYDIQGRLIATYAMREGIRHRVSLPFLQPGIYLLQVRDGQQQQALKVVIGQ